jgi:hypothetical protein
MPCELRGPGEACGIRVGISPYLWNGGPFGGFQSVAGTSYQRDIVITFSQPVMSVSITALDPDFAANRMLAYSGSLLVDSVTFAGDNTPGVFTTSRKTVQGCGITRVVLHPDPKDYIAYRDLEFEG